MIRDLNQKYESYIHELSSQDLAYRRMVDKHPPRFLSGFTYGEDPKPLRSQRIAVPPVETDVIDLVLLVLGVGKNNNRHFYYFIICLIK